MVTLWPTRKNGYNGEIVARAREKMASNGKNVVHS